MAKDRELIKLFRLTTTRMTFGISMALFNLLRATLTGFTL